MYAHAHAHISMNALTHILQNHVTLGIQPQKHAPPNMHLVNTYFVQLVMFVHACCFEAIPRATQTHSGACLWDNAATNTTTYEITRI